MPEQIYKVLDEAAFYIKDKAKFITAYVADGTNGKGEKAIDLIRSSEKW